jgi:ABC-2 type transport system ATP-binding protein
VNKLSGGQQRRLDVAIALAGDPELLFLDEPTTGFDPNARRNAWEVVKNLISIGKTVFLTTHFMDEAQYLADRVVVIAGGLIVAEGPPASIAGREQMRTRIRFRLPNSTPDPDPRVRRLPDGTYELQVEANETTKTVHDLTGWALDHGFELEAFEITLPTLEDVYLQLTGAEVGT